MKFLDYSYDAPQDNLACDEALLDESEAADGDEILRFWTSPAYFAVLGYSNILKDETLDTVDVPVFRRCSGGGTVLQGPGCLNYALILDLSPEGPHGAHLNHITASNRYVMERQRKALSALLGKEVRVQGHTDLTLGPQKFSGNSQRRKKSRLLFHGTFLLDFDLARIGRCLKFPPKQPVYRDGRPHSDFVTNLGVPEQDVKEALKREWAAEKKLPSPPLERVADLVKERYSKDAWNLKF